MKNEKCATRGNPDRQLCIGLSNQNLGKKNQKHVRTFICLCGFVGNSKKDKHAHVLTDFCLVWSAVLILNAFIIHSVVGTWNFLNNS